MFELKNENQSEVWEKDLLYVEGVLNHINAANFNDEDVTSYRTITEANRERTLIVHFDRQWSTWKVLAKVKSLNANKHQIGFRISEVDCLMKKRVE